MANLILAPNLQRILAATEQVAVVARLPAVWEIPRSNLPYRQFMCFFSQK